MGWRNGFLGHSIMTCSLKVEEEEKGEEEKEEEDEDDGF